MVGFALLNPPYESSLRAMTTCEIVLATRLCVRALRTTTPKKVRPPAPKEGAERRKAHCPTNVRGSQTSLHRRQVYAVCVQNLSAQLICYAAAQPLRRGAPAFRRSRLRHSPPAITPMAQPQNRVSSRHDSQGVLPVRRIRLELSTLRADRSFCRPTGAPEPPGSGSHPSARGDRTRSHLPKVPSRKAPLVSGVRGM